MFSFAYPRKKLYLCTLKLKDKIMENKVAENPFKNRVLAETNRLEDGANAPTERSHASYSLEARGKNTSFIVVTALFVTLYVVSNVMAVKVIGLWNLFYFDAGTITFPFAYMLGDVLTEIWGYKTARKVIFTTLLCNIVMVVCTQIGVWLPSPDYLDATAQAYNTMFSYVPRIVIASLTGFLLGELSNAWLMEKIKRWTNGKRLWVRTIGSSAVAYWFDSLPFVLIAFAGTVSTHDLLLMIAFQYVSKLLIEAVLGTHVIRAMGEMKIDLEQNIITLPAEQSEPQSKNLSFHQGNYGIDFSYDGMPLVAHLDTGRVKSDLSQRFYGYFPAMVDSVAGERIKSSRSGVGGSREYEIVRLPQITLNVADRAVTFGNVDVITAGHPSAWDGVMGADLLKGAGTTTLNLKKMYFRIDK